MQTKRDYLVGLGLAKPGRGKFSNAAKEALAKAIAEGVQFSDAAAVVLTKGGGKTEAATASVAKSADADTPYLTPDEYRFPEAEYRAFTFVNGKRREVSMRECCNTCRVSLVNHGCESPTIHTNVMVKIERRS